MVRARAAAVVTWIYVACFGVPSVPIAVFISRNGRLPSFFGLFDMYGGPWSSTMIGSDNSRFVVRLLMFLALHLVVAGAAWLLWRGSRIGASLSLITIPAEAVFWIGFALPFPWLIAAIRVALIATAWRSLSRQVPGRTPTS